MNVALIKLSSLGDVVHALPVAATLRARLAGARITWIVERREAAVLAGHPALDDVLTVDTRRWRRARARDLLGTARAIRALAARMSLARFDVALDLQGLLKSAVLGALTRAPVRIGFAGAQARELSGLFSNRRVSPPADAHVVEQYLALLAPLGVREPVLEFRLPSDSVAEAAMDELFAAAGLKPRNRVVVINPGAGRADKRWPPERFAAVARHLIREAEAHVLVVWGPGGELATARAIVEGGGQRAILAPPTDLAQLIALLRRASVMIAADTGPLHVAAALGTACVGIYGPTRATRNGPYGAGHRALQGADGRVDSVGVDAVVAAAIEALG